MAVRVEWIELARRIWFRPRGLSLDLSVQCIRLSLFSAMLPPRNPPSKPGFARSKAKAVDPEIARNQNYDDHYANDSEDVHSVYSRFMMIARGVLAQLASTSHFYRHRLYPQ